MIKVNIYFRIVNNETLPVLDALRKAHLPVKIWLHRSGVDYIKNLRTRDIPIITNCRLNDGRHDCYRWDIVDRTGYLETDGLGEMMAMIEQRGSGFICVDSRAHPCSQIVLFRDSERHDDCPDKFLRVRSFVDYQSVKDYVDSIPEKFELADNPEFRKTSHQVKGAIVYGHRTTGRYWHIDTLHKDHFEVYDPDGKHLGIADLNGNIDTTKREKDRRIAL